ncbi:hypothetical protein DBB29_08735 [Pandoraea cepalis]|uniref:Type II toxin-antitoxin system HicA family toxin n=1 Tax=Pandoraea cepalis TaxID=2508294 RepID=A0AAW7MLM2_9BURK|nr:hypothetical protein [Pandoraea cepalis]MDN4573659.1 hypothetical protein [Pandoraea cepalis]MDN4578201.1 hypothetical protein [Pandoraea cepalis]
MSKHYSSDKDMHAVVADLVKDGWTYQAKGRSKHPKVIAPNGRKMTYPLTPSDWRAVRNLRRDAARLAALPPAKTNRC